MTYLLGIDVGTSGSKALLTDDAGAVLATATTAYPMFTPRPLWAEQNPDDWWTATATSIRQLLDQTGVQPGDIAGVGLTGQMHGLVLLDRDDQILRPCIMWNDQRTAAQCAALTRKIGSDRILRLTGNPILPGFTAPKIAWVRQHEPDVYVQVAHILLPKDYVRLRLTGAHATEVSDASGTSLFDVGQRRWSEEMLAAMDIPIEWMPVCAESPDVTARISEAGAAATGLLAGTPVVGGGGDQAAQAVGTGIFREGVISVTVGTSGVVFASTDTYRPEPEGRLHAFCHAVPGKWHLMGVMLSAGGSFRWFRDALGEPESGAALKSGRDPYEPLVELAAQAPAGCEGLLFLPYLTGERTPHPDPEARGVYFGLTLRHGKSHMVRAVLEGVSYGLKDSLELMKDLGVPLEQVRGSGGGVRSALWRQILADVFDTELVTVNTTEGAAYGAALLAGVGAGVYADVPDACAKTITTVDQVVPGCDNVVYADYYPLYRSLYPALKPAFDATAGVVAIHMSGS
ncbi:MAG: xylulokinase [Chloroflexi bacterium]|nr:xylulokinase [Chloroflexota bacterium]